MLGLKQRSELTAINIINAVLAVFLFLSPWLVGYRDVQIASWNAGACGLVIGLMAAFAIARLQEWEEWSTAALGLWTAVAPWIMGFAGSMAAMWAHVLVGLAVLALAAVELWLIHGSPPSKTAYVRAVSGRRAGRRHLRGPCPARAGKGGARLKTQVRGTSDEGRCSVQQASSGGSARTARLRAVTDA